MTRRPRCNLTPLRLRVESRDFCRCQRPTFHYH
jgi:hypothetical protein